MSHVQDGGFNIISRTKVLPSGECTRSLCPAHMHAVSASSWSIVHSHLLCTCFVADSLATIHPTCKSPEALLPSVLLEDLAYHGVTLELENLAFDSIP